MLGEQHGDQSSRAEIPLDRRIAQRGEIFLEAGHFQRYTGRGGRVGIPDPRGVERRSIHGIHGRANDEQRRCPTEHGHRFPPPVPQQEQFTSDHQRHRDQDPVEGEEGGWRAILQSELYYY